MAAAVQTWVVSEMSGGLCDRFAPITDAAALSHADQSVVNQGRYRSRPEHSGFGAVDRKIWVVSGNGRLDTLWASGVTAQHQRARLRLQSVAVQVTLPY